MHWLASILPRLPQTLNQLGLEWRRAGQLDAVVRSERHCGDQRNAERCKEPDSAHGKHALWSLA
jgi:hypothetical protein